MDPEGLKNYGGPVLTVAIQKAGSAYDAGTATNAPLADARGIARPQFEGYDIGAFELSPEDFRSSFPGTCSAGDNTRKSINPEC